MCLKQKAKNSISSPLEFLSFEFRRLFVVNYVTTVYAVVRLATRCFFRRFFCFFLIEILRKKEQGVIELLIFFVFLLTGLDLSRLV